MGCRVVAVACRSNRHVRNDVQKRIRHRFVGPRHAWDANLDAKAPYEQD
jgi:hypothetical protein